jgi:hypothetical protein
MIDPLRVCAFGALLLGACTLKSGISNVHTALVGTTGKGGKMGFSYAGLVKSCQNVDCPMMPGTRELIVIDPSQPLDVVFESSDPNILAIEPGQSLEESNGVRSVDGTHITAVHAGTAELRVKTASGEIVDRIDLVVETPARIGLAWDAPDGGPTGTDHATLKVGTYVSFGATAYRADGSRLQAAYGWTFTGDTPAVVRVDDACVFICIAGDTGFRATGIGGGSAKVSATGGGVTGTATVDVTP